MTAISMDLESPLPGVPSSGLEWRRWAREQIERLELSAGEANVLRLLADRANAGGKVTLGIAILVRQLRLSESQVYRLLRALTGRGLLRTRPRGRGRVPLRELLAEPAQRQLSLFDDAVQNVGCGPLSAVPAGPPAPVPVAAASNVAAADTGRASRPAPVAPGEPCPRIDATMPSHRCDPAVEGAGEKNNSGSGSARERAPHPSPTSPSLDRVLAILAEAPNLHVEESAVDVALRAFPTADHERAALQVVMRASEEGLNCMLASFQLWRALERQRPDRPQRSRPGGPAGGHDGRRRPGAFQIVGGKYDRAAGIA